MTGGREKLMLANFNRLPRFQMDRKNMAGAIARKSDLARSLRFRHKNRHPRHDPLEGAFHRADADIDVDLFPKHDVVLEEEGD